MIKTLNGKWNYRIGKGEWTTKVVPFSELCVGHSEYQRCFDLDTTSDVVLLKFDGITYNAEVYLNDIHIGKMIPYSDTFLYFSLCLSTFVFYILKLDVSVHRNIGLFCLLMI